MNKSFTTDAGPASTSTLHQTIHALAVPLSAIRTKSIVRRVEARRAKLCRKGGTAVPVTYVRQSLASHRRFADAMTAWVFVVPTLILFSVFTLHFRDVEAEFHAANSVRRALGEAALPLVDPTGVAANTTDDAVDPNDVTTYALWTFSNVGQEFPDLYSALKLILLPTVVRSNSTRADWLSLFCGLTNGSSCPASSSQPSVRTATFPGYEPLGALRIRSRHVRGGLCGNFDRRLFEGAAAQGYFRATCFVAEEGNGALNRSDLSGSASVPWSFSDGDCEAVLSQYASLRGDMGRYPCGGSLIDVPFNVSQEFLFHLSDTMLAQRYGNSLSLRLFDLEYFVAHGLGDVILHVEAFVEVSSGGGYSPSIRVTPFRRERDAGWLVLAVILMALYLAFTAIATAWAAVLDWYENESSTWVLVLLRPQYLFEWTTFVVFLSWFVVVVLWWASGGDAKDSALASSSTFPLFLCTTEALYTLTNSLAAVNLLLLFLRLLHLVSFNARIAALHRSLARAARTLLGLGALLCFWVLAFSLAGVVLFGSQLAEYRTVAIAWTTLFRALIGQFDYDGMYAVYHSGAVFVYFWLFIVFGVFVLVSFCTAALMDSVSVEPSNRSVISAWRTLTHIVEDACYDVYRQDAPPLRRRMWNWLRGRREEPSAPELEGLILVLVKETLIRKRQQAAAAALDASLNDPLPRESKARRMSSANTTAAFRHPFGAIGSFVERRKDKALDERERRKRLREHTRSAFWECSNWERCAVRGCDLLDTLAALLAANRPEPTVLGPSSSMIAATGGSAADGGADSMLASTTIQLRLAEWSQYSSEALTHCVTSFWCRCCSAYRQTSEAQESYDRSDRQALVLSVVLRTLATTLSPFQQKWERCVEVSGLAAASRNRAVATAAACHPSSNVAGEESSGAHSPPTTTRRRARALTLRAGRSPFAAAAEGATGGSAPPGGGEMEESVHRAISISDGTFGDSESGRSGGHDRARASHLVGTQLLNFIDLPTFPILLCPSGGGGTIACARTVRESLDDIQTKVARMDTRLRGALQSYAETAISMTPGAPRSSHGSPTVVHFQMSAE